MIMFSEQEQKKEVCCNMHQGEGMIEITYLVDSDNLPEKARLIAKVDFDREGYIGAHAHENEEEIFYILEGQGLQNIDGECREVKAGDVIVTKPNEMHSLRNIGESRLKLISIIISN